MLFEAGFSEAHLSFTISLLQCLAMGGKQHKPSFCGFSEFSIENVPEWKEKKCEGAAHSTLPPQDSDCIPPSQGPGCNRILGPSVYPSQGRGCTSPQGLGCIPQGQDPSCLGPPLYLAPTRATAHTVQEPLLQWASTGKSEAQEASWNPFCPSNAASPSLSA